MRAHGAQTAPSPRRARGTIAVSPGSAITDRFWIFDDHHPFPLEPNAVDAQAAIAEEFSFFGDWSERYQYLIDLGRKLPSFPEQWKTEEHRLHGCQSMVWIVPEGNAERLDFHAVSDSAIVSGLIYLALRVYSGRSAQEILATEPDYIAGIGLAKHLSPTRSNGVAAMLAFIRDTARAQQ
ncbi:SufE family protein [Xanthomonas arboricola pv. corylina]|nr:SufE family protein [Xanthomonas arboricola pv. corylina]